MVMNNTNHSNEDQRYIFCSEASSLLDEASMSLDPQCPQSNNRWISFQELLEESIGDLLSRTPFLQRPGMQEY